MKYVSKKLGLVVRLGATAIALLIGQQAMAEGTDAGTQIDNTATVNYSVGTVQQTALTDTVSFVVDRRVDFTLTVVDETVEAIAPGQQDVFVDFLVAHTGNSDLDFDISVADLIGDSFGTPAVTDNVNLNNVEWAVSAQTVAGGDSDPVQGGPQFIDELPEDAAIRIRVWGDADFVLGLVNGDASGVALTVTAHEAGAAGLGAILTAAVSNDDATVDNVLNDAGNDGTETASDGWQVSAPDLTVTKAYAVFSDPLNSGYPIPGAVIEYTVTIENSNATQADDVYLSDFIDSDVTLNLNVVDYSGNDVNVVNGATTLACNVENNTDGDGCDLNPGNELVIGDVAESPIDVAGNTTLTIQYRVTIPTP